jgi:hypothetical protein
MVEIKDTPTQVTESSFWDEIEWSQVTHNKIDKGDFLRIKSINRKLYSTFLGPESGTQFYLYKPLSWGKYKEIRLKGLDKDTTREYIINSCILWPNLDPISVSNLDAGIMLTLTNQILTVSNFLKDPDKALELILEIE